VHVSGVGAVAVSVVDVAHACAFVRSADVGVPASSTVAELNADPALLVRLEAVRATCSVLLGRATSLDDATAGSPAVPRLVLVDPPGQWRSPSETGTAGTVDVGVRMVSMGKVHHACTITGAVCTSAAALIAGTVVSAEVMPHADRPLRIGHPKGVVEAHAVLGDAAAEVCVDSVSVTRTARRLMAGQAYVPGSTLGGPR
jgi:2-methylaconitate cis-trans-isomerase PrpF